MKRGETGVYESTTFGGEAVRAFVPKRLPPEPPLDLAVPPPPPLEKASLALGSLNSVSTLLPGTRLFLYTYVSEKRPYFPLKSRARNPHVVLIFCCSNWRERRARPLTTSSRFRTTWRRSNMAWRACGMIFRSQIASSVKSMPGCSRGGVEAARTRANSGALRTGSAGAGPLRRTSCPCRRNRVAECMSDLERFLHAEDLKTLRVAHGGSRARSVRDHPSLSGRQWPRRAAFDHALVVARGRITRADAVSESLFQTAPRGLLRALGRRTPERRLGGVARVFS